MAGPLQGVSPGLSGGVSSALGLSAAAVIKNAPGILVRVSVLASGTITLNDLATTSGGATGNEIFSGAVTAGQVVELNWPCFTGIALTATTAGAVISVAYT